MITLPVLFFYYYYSDLNKMIKISFEIFLRKHPLVIDGNPPTWVFQHFPFANRQFFFEKNRDWSFHTPTTTSKPFLFLAGIGKEGKWVFRSRTQFSGNKILTNRRSWIGKKSCVVEIGRLRFKKWIRILNYCKK